MTDKHRPCVTHHHACDCRETEFEKLRRQYDELRALVERMGVVTDEEIEQLGEFVARHLGDKHWRTFEKMRDAIAALITRKLETK